MIHQRHQGLSLVIFLGRMVILETSIQKHWKHHTITQISYSLIIIRNKKCPSFMFLRSISILMLQVFSGLQRPSVALKLLTSPASTSSKVGIRPLRPSEHFHLENSTDDLISEPLADSQSPRSPKSFGNVSRGIGIFALSKFSNAYL